MEEVMESADDFARLDSDGIDDYNSISVGADDGGSIYPNATIKIERDQYSIYEMKRKYDRGKLVLDPEFQRNFVWSKKQQSELIESVIMGIPLPIIYLAENKDGAMTVVDGRQRLTTFIRFLNNEFRLDGLKVLTDLNRMDLHTLEKNYPNYVSIIEDYQLVVQVIKYPTPDRIRFDIFDRVNRGGTTLNKQEMRNALYQGEATRLLMVLAEGKEFKQATGYGISGKHMKDRYMILRALAFCLLYQRGLLDDNGVPIEYKSDIDDLMSKTMVYLNTCSADQLERIKGDFENVMTEVYKNLGADAFRIPNNGAAKRPRRPVSMTLFETIYYLFYLIRGLNIAPNVIVAKYKNMIADGDYLESLQHSVDSATSVESRFKKVIQVAGEMKEYADK